MNNLIEPSHFLTNVGGEYLRAESEMKLSEAHDKPGVNFTSFTRENSKAYIFDYPMELQKILKDTFQDPKKHGYNDSMGIESLRNALAHMYSTPMHKLSAHDVVITSGIEMSHVYLYYTLCDEGDNFIAPKNTHRNIDDFPASLKVQIKKAELEEIPKEKDEKTKFLYIKNPNEPFGKYEYDVMAYKKVANEAGIPLVINEELISLPFEGETSFRSTTNFLGKESVILINSANSLMLAPGFRLGFLVFYDPQNLFGHVMEGIEKIAQMFLHPSIPLQFAATEILKSPGLQAYLKKAQGYFIDSFEQLEKELGGIMGIRIHKPEYGYFAAVELENHDASEKFTLAKKFLEQENVLVHCSEYNGKTVFKISLFNKGEDYSELGERLSDFLK